MPAYTYSTKYLHINIKCMSPWRSFQPAAARYEEMQTLTRDLNNTETEAWHESVTAWPPSDLISPTSLTSCRSDGRGDDARSLQKSTADLLPLLNQTWYFLHFTLNRSQPANASPTTTTFLGDADSRHSFVTLCYIFLAACAFSSLAPSSSSFRNV